MYSYDLELYARTTRGRVDFWKGTLPAIGLKHRRVFIMAIGKMHEFTLRLFDYDRTMNKLGCVDGSSVDVTE